ncbi:MAG: hypothetical protein WA208_00770 [Thermoanaerobaculia bacterium]
MAKNEQTDDRRARVRELWTKSDSVLADVLIAEGYFGPRTRTARAIETQRDTARRTIRRDRDWWRAKWAEEKSAASRMTRGEYLTTLQSNIEELRTALEDDELRMKDRVEALREMRQSLEAIGKAEGYAVAAPGGEDDPDGSADAGPTVLVLDVSRCSADVKRAVVKGGK